MSQGTDGRRSDTPSSRLRTSWLRGLYVALTYAVVPLLLAHLAWRSLRVPAYRAGIPERFGFGRQPLPGPSIWVHAVSVGEVQAAAPLVRELLHRYPDRPLVVTTMTPTGAARVRALFGDRVIHSYVPYDLASGVRRFFDWARPSIAIVMETELWPNLYHECGRRRVPLVLASARVSLRSLRYYRRLVPLFRDTLSHGIVIAAQTETDAERFLSLGANPRHTRVTGNIKFDVELRQEVRQRGLEFRASHAAGRPVWIAASTHEGEEEVVLAAHRQLLVRYPRSLLILVPRHPARFDGVAELVRSSGFRSVRRSSNDPVTDDTQVFVGDSMGELVDFYAASDVAFVGGSLVRIGGHNLLEPAALGMAALTGPHNENAADIAELLVKCGAAEIVGDDRLLAEGLERLLDDPAERARRGAAGQAAIEANRGALERLLELIEPIIPPVREAPPASTPASREAGR